MAFDLTVRAMPRSFVWGTSKSLICVDTLPRTATGHLARASAAALNLHTLGVLSRVFTADLLKPALYRTQAHVLSVLTLSLMLPRTAPGVLAPRL